MNINDKNEMLNKQIEDLTEVVNRTKEFIKKSFDDCETRPQELEDILYRINSIDNKISNKGYYNELLNDIRKHSIS